MKDALRNAIRDAVAEVGDPIAQLALPAPGDVK